MTFLSQNTPAAFSVKSTAQPINGQSIHQTIQQLKGGHQDASSAIISNFKDDLRKMRGELEEEMEMELKATHAKLKKLGKKKKRTKRRYVDSDDDDEEEEEDEDEEEIVSLYIRRNR